MSATIDPLDAQLDRIMDMTVEEMAASEGKTVEQVLEEGRQFGERVLALLRQQYPGRFKDATP